MDSKPYSPNSWERVGLERHTIKKFFTTHLDRIYAAKIHLVKKLPALVQQAQFFDLKQAINETVEGVSNQIARMQMIYTILDTDVAKGSIHGLIGLIEDAFEAIQQQDGEPELQDLSIIFYLQLIESVEMASFQILQMAAAGLQSTEISNLLEENYQEAKSDRTLLLLISSKYITN